MSDRAAEQMTLEHSYLIARQPIVDSVLNLVGYELLYRRTPCQKNQAVTGTMATAQVLSTSLSETDLNELVGEATAFINMTREAILNIDLLSLPSQRVVFEILEDIKADAILLQKLQLLTDKGYRFALDDFCLMGLHQDIIALADVVKLDVMALSRAELVEHVHILRQSGVRLIAEKVESWEMFEFCKALGFDLYQGYFFAKPQLVSGRSISHSRATTFRLVSRLNDPEVGFDELEQLVSQDPALSYKLFRYANSALVASNRTFNNLRQVLVLLGLNRLRALATMFAMCRMDAKPMALVQTLLLRAQLCRLLAETRQLADSEDYFTVGMFSLIDAFMDKPIAEALGSMPLPPSHIGAILEHSGPMGQVLSCAIEIEQQSCATCESHLREGDNQLLLYNAAAHWAVEAMQMLADSID